MPVLIWLRRVTIALISLVVVGYVGVCPWLKVNEHRLVFTRHLPTEPIWESFGLQPQTVQIGTLGSVPVFAWRIPSLPNDSSANQWILFFHGSGDNVTSAWNQAEFHRLRGLGFLAS